ncbi:sialate O-acetylesterase [Akkermansiaceae bacterium]|nr:sialate O-acetylesterase [Akkermansiaceae bacterium]
MADMNQKNLRPGIPASLLAAVTLSSALLHAEVKPNPLFTDGAVLQRGQAVPIWGTAKDGEKVSVEFAGQKAETTAKGGKWSVSLKPLEAGGPFTMKISGENTVTVGNLLVGEVWVCSGQSNMEWKFKATAAADQDRADANYPKLRMFTVARTTSPLPLAKAKGSWVECSPQTVDGFSAVGYYFARDLHEKLGVPVGMISTSWGGTPAQAWTSAEGFGGHAELDGYAKVAKENLAKYATAAPEKPLGPGIPASLYNGMIEPLLPYAIKGAIWYQGESNAGKSKEYQTLFPAMIADWRAKWKQGDFPFYFVQIAPFKGQPAEIREAQFLTLSKSKNTAMVVTTDVGDANDIHPRRKRPVGERLALAARALVYGEKTEYSGPLYESMEAKGDKVALSFGHVGGGLVAEGGDLKGFTIAGADGQFVPAKAEIKGDQVLVSAEGVSEPKAVRYGWANVPDVNLFNKEGLPASPFRTDVE